ncbi:NAD(P)/FAD-dependent oxidoreductase [Arenicella xantha]|uniref:NAD(P)-binding protein n=1 Tax=Arenicella xantha TaxID=644221 RepID=A0A395JQF9_9GAMM|nr:NAD(P)/FAD-dependent oxidoreductase [Arenicella xantha]RBP52795.1 hypothetical protein DFR28_101179 [Arenicella xantha]
MHTTQLETDYLIIGCGAVGMAFADVLLAETDANIIIVDKHHKPGGHWNDAYSFVTLHQPSAFYGVSSLELSNGKRDEIGMNKGLHELASGPEVLSYFDQVMKHQFLPSGRVQYFPMCDYRGNGEFSSMLSDKQYKVTVNRKIIDGTYFKTSVPATHTPNFEIADGVQFAPLNDLPNLTEPKDGYVVVGGGKTGIDACLWLLDNHIDPDDITWIMPRDGWWIDRKNTQPTREFFNYSIGAQVKQMEALANAESLDDLFVRLEAGGVLLRLDKNVKPAMFHGATVSQEEATQLRRISNVVRHGRVSRIGLNEITFADTAIATTPNTLHIDCSARAVPVTETYPVFNGDTVTVQTVRSYQPVFSAAFIAHIEANYDDEAIKNDICKVVPLPNHDVDWLIGAAAQMQNQYRWSQEPGLRDWLIQNRLDGFTALVQPSDEATPEQMQLLGKLKELVPMVIANLPKLMGEAMQRKQAL